ncbi:hypothetical protein Scep_004935 [Stephania cephalantha]|uniref:Uncharacterized protein n=1 Tax=Stephania cephalantha TaxID=152367 RepID=A0AAP0KTD6_9MAGN
MSENKEGQVGKEGKIEVEKVKDSFIKKAYNRPGTQFLTRSMDLNAKARGMEVGTRKSQVITKVPLARPKSSQLDHQSKFVSEHCRNDKAHETKEKRMSRIIRTNAKAVTVKKLVKVS